MLLKLLPLCLLCLLCGVMHKFSTKNSLHCDWPVLFCDNDLEIGSIELIMLSKNI